LEREHWVGHIYSLQYSGGLVIAQEGGFIPSIEMYLYS